MGIWHQLVVLEPQWEHPLNVLERPAPGCLARRMPRSTMYGLKTCRCIQAPIQLNQSSRNDVSLSSIRKIRANHLGSNFRLGAEAQFVNHAVQTSQ